MIPLASNGFNKLSDKRQLSGYLHDLGVCLHFQDDPLLRKTLILKPQWGADAVYKVLDNREVIRKLGKFTTKDLEDIWYEDDYESMLGDLLQLMIKFKLCYRVMSLINTYIAPQLLSANQPNYDWSDLGNLHLRYSYEFMPKGIISQFIVTMHSLILDESCVWKSGVVLTKNETKVEVIEDVHDRQIKIRVTGKRQRDLLTIVMHELNRNNQLFKKLECKKLVPCNCSECEIATMPEFYACTNLEAFVDKQLDKQCQRSGEMVNPSMLLDRIPKPDNKQNVRQRSVFVSHSSEDNPKIRELMRIATPEPKYQPSNKVFVSYSHEDTAWLQKFKQMLKPIEHNNQFAIWSDTDIHVRARWAEDIKEAIYTSKIAVLLVSPAFLASDFIIDNELPPILNLAKSKGLTIMWVPVSDCMYERTTIAEYQATFDPQTPLDSLSRSDLNTALKKICKT